MNTAAAHQGFSRRDTLKQAGTFAALAAVPAGLLSSRAMARDVVLADPAVTGLAKGLSSQPAGYYRTKVGSFPVVVISDGYGQIPQAYPTFAPEAGSAGALDAVLAASFCPPTLANMYFQTLVIDAPSGKILVDTGYGALGGETNAALLPNLAAAGIKPADISAVFITHLHPDHAGGLLNKDGSMAFPDAEVYVTKTEADFWTGSNPDLSKVRMPKEALPGFIKMATDALTGVKKKLHLVPDDYKLSEGVTLKALPGHTPGHTGVMIENGNDRLLYWADIAHHFAIMLPKPDWTIGFDTDPAVAVETRKAVLKMVAAERIKVGGTHLPFPALGHVRAVGTDAMAYEWVPDSYLWQ